MRRQGLRVLGTLLYLAGLAGSYTYADDLRHTGELVVAVGLLAVGGLLRVAAAVANGGSTRR